MSKGAIPAGTPIVVLGGPAMLIGLGGGAASSMSSGASAEDLDFASVQRGNPEMERRAQEVIDACWALGERNPILSIHDVGAGRSVQCGSRTGQRQRAGRTFRAARDSQRRPGHVAHAGMVQRIAGTLCAGHRQDRLAEFQAICERERCPFAVLGEATEEPQLLLGDGHFDNTPIDLPMGLLLGKPPKHAA